MERNEKEERGRKGIERKKGMEGRNEEGEEEEWGRKGDGEK